MPGNYNINKLETDNTKKKNGYYLSLEILRGLCALEVVIWHCLARVDDVFLRISPTFEFIYYSFLRGSDIAIIGFFVLSGFVTSESFVSYFSKYNPVKATIIFYIARMIRIWSLTFTTVLVSVAVAWHYRTFSGDWTEWRRYDNFDIFSIIKSAFGLSAHWNAPMWTLGYEIAFYSILPLIMLIVMRTNYTIKISAVMVMGLIAYLFFISDIASIYNLYIPFALGVAIYFIKDVTWVWHFFQSSVRKFTIFSISIISVIYLSCEYLPKEPYSIPKFFFIALAILNLVFCEDFFIKHKDVKIIKILSGLSACSYSLYLWHWMILWFTGLYMLGSIDARTMLEIYVLFSIAIPTLILVTWMSWYFIERNARMRNLLSLIERWK